MENNVRILIVEDEGAIIEHLKARFKNEFEFVEAYSYLSAIGNWNKYQGIFDCIIIDLQISLEGLEEDERSDNYYPLIGLAFIEDICKKFDPEGKMNLLKKMIIFSGFINNLKNGDYKKKDWILDNIQCIAKDSDSIQILVDKIKEIVYE